MYKLITKKILVVIMSLTLLMLLGSTAVWAQDGDDVTQDQAANVHGVPKYPIIVDGVRYKPEEITRFNGQPLITVVTEQTDREGVLYIFTTEKGAKDYLSSQSLSEGGQTLQIDDNTIQMAGCPSPFSDKTLAWQVTNCSGGSEAYYNGASCRNTIYPPQQVDGISSVVTISNGHQTKFWDNSSCTGSSLVLPSGIKFPDLGVYGWNNRLKSGKIL
jgi:hypothetical protein